MTRCPVCKGSTIVFDHEVAKVAVTVEGGHEIVGKDGQIYASSEESETDIIDYGRIVSCQCATCGYRTCYDDVFTYPLQEVACCVYFKQDERRELLGIYSVTHDHSIEQVKEEVLANLPEGRNMSQVRYFSLESFFGIRAVAEQLDSSTDPSYRAKLYEVCKIYQDGEVQLFA